MTSSIMLNVNGQVKTFARSSSPLTPDLNREGFDSGNSCPDTQESIVTSLTQAGQVDLVLILD